MGCCGDKRKAWLDESRPSVKTEVTNNHSTESVSDQPDKVFEYTGNGALNINGAVSGKTYSFRFTGDKIAVDYLDAFALMAEADLKVSS